VPAGRARHGIHWIGAIRSPGTASSALAGGVALGSGDTPNEIRALISVHSATPGVSYPWEIQSGRCGENGPTIGSASTLRPLSANVDGTAQVNTLIAAPLPTMGRYHVNIYGPRAARDQVIACGNLDSTRTGSM
jgi:hypothetical protein